MNGLLFNSPTSDRRRTHQRGSALLIVLVFAAIVAILLFMQMPVLIFEAQRNKEQLLVDRGNEYKQGIRLYYRKFQRYPPSFDALENTNRVRFLRKRFKDPFTDKDDWRLIHAGPNGIPIDSKLKIAQPQAGAQTSSGGGNSPLGSFNNGQNQSGSQPPFGGSNTFGGSSGFGGSNSFGNGGFGSSGNSGSTGFGGSPSNPGGTGGGGLGNPNSFGGFNSPSRAPQPVNSGSSSSANPPGFEGGIAPNADGVDPNVVPSAPSQAHGVNGLPLAAGESGGALQAATPSGVPQPVITRSAVPNGTNGSATGGAAPSQFSQSGGIAPGGALQPNADAFNPNGAVNSLLSNPNPQTPQTAGAAGFNTSTGVGGGSTFGGSTTGRNGPFGSSSNNSSSGFGVIQSGGVGGVASKAERHSIKLINDQQQYSLWEFYYDPNKDPLRNGAGALNQIGGGNGASAQFGNTGIGSLPGSSGSNGAANGLFTRGPSPFADSNNGPSNFGNPGSPAGAAPSANPQTPTTPAAPPQ